MASQSKEARHWADATAERIVRTRGERDRYVLAAGITASGPVQFGNMREIMTPDAAAELRPPLRGVFEQQMARLGIEPEWSCRPPPPSGRRSVGHAGRSSYDTAEEPRVASVSDLPLVRAGPTDASTADATHQQAAFRRQAAAVACFRRS